MSRITPAIREQVRNRAANRCEYYRKPDDVTHYSHQVEHIIALKHQGSSALDNLAWACFQCNSFKGSDIASIDEATGALTRLFNPRIDLWNEHFLMDNFEIVGRTPVGRVTVRVLQMNHPNQLETRIFLSDTGR